MGHLYHGEVLNQRVLLIGSWDILELRSWVVLYGWW